MTDGIQLTILMSTPQEDRGDTGLRTRKHLIERRSFLETAQLSYAFARWLERALASLTLVRTIIARSMCDQMRGSCSSVLQRHSPPDPRSA
jgi:hypothetical protein